MPDGKLIVISGPSGSGKSTITRATVTRTGAILSVSATTRPRTGQETGGVDYSFVSKDSFEASIRAGEFLEYARVFDNYYGTPRAPVLAQLNAGQTVLLEIDVQGGLQVFEQMPGAVGVLILPPNLDELKRRLLSRRRDDEAVIEKRLQKAQWEIDTAQTSGRYHHIVINDDLNRAIDRVVAIVQSQSIMERYRND